MSVFLMEKVSVFLNKGAFLARNQCYKGISFNFDNERIYTPVNSKYQSAPPPPPPGYYYGNMQ